MDTDKITKEAEFLIRRMSENFDEWVIGIPVLFAFLVLGLMVLFRRENRFAGMLIPFLVVTLASAFYVPLALYFKPFFSWWVVLVPMLAIALLYVGLMYVKDSQTIHPLAAGFLGLLRCTVYAILAFVFLLPGCQNYDRTETASKVLFLFDVSGSMGTVDDLPETGQDPAKLPTRQDKVIELVAGKAALVQKVLDKTDIVAYRFGSVADEGEVVKLNTRDGQAWTPDGKVWTAAEWAAWLKPDKKKIKVDPSKSADEQLKEKARKADLYDALIAGTNVPGAANQIAKAETGSFLQAIVIFSDGQSNVGSDEGREFLNRVNNPKRPIQVYTVGVGEYRQPAAIRIDDLQAPEIARPDDKFPVRVPVVSQGLQDEDFQVTLELIRVEDALGKPVGGEKRFVLPSRKGKFKGQGDNLTDTVEFEIDIQELKGIKSVDDKNGDLEGTYEFVARVPRNPKEAYPKAEHVSDPPTRVLIQKKKMRILLFAGGAGRDYQFIRTLLYREVIEKRVEMSVLLQTGRDEHVDQDVEGERLLSRFPDTLKPSKDKHMSLNDYDVILAIDPDWTAIGNSPAENAEMLKLVKEWVSNHSGGIIFVAGPVHTFHLARPGGLDLSSLLTIYPVVLKDSRLHGLGIGHDPTRPYPLSFTTSAKLYEFLKLDEAGEYPTAGWDEFFWGKDKKAPEPGKDAKPIRGIYNYYPVERLKPASIPIINFEGPASSRINDGKDPQPYLVTMPFGNGKTVYVGSAESWRLRTYKESFHERFWIKLARYVAAGTVHQKKYGRILLGRISPAGNIAFEAQIKGSDLQVLPRDSKPTVFVRKIGEIDAKPMTFDLKAKTTQGDWNGWFVGKIDLREPGEYEFKVPIGGTSETLSHRLTIKKPNLELDNVKNNFDALYPLTSDAKDVLTRVSEKLGGEARIEVERALRSSVAKLKEGAPEKDKQRLFFYLPHAGTLTKCITQVPPHVESTKGSLQDLWDQGFKPGMSIDAYFLAMLIPFAVGLLGAAILLVLRQFVAAGAFFGATLLVVLGVAVFGDPDWPNLPIDFSYVLITVVTLLSIEWLTRKLLKLA